MNKPRVIIFATLLCLSAFAKQEENPLLSSVQSTRDEAALKLRKSFTPPLASRWNAFLKKIKKGMNKNELLKMEELADKSSEMGACGGSSCSESYRLDDLFLLKISFIVKDNTVHNFEIVEQMKHLWVAPPKNFSGTWTTYFVNGHKSHEIQYKDGEYFGTFTTYTPRGNKSVVQNYSKNGIDGESVGYFENGAVSYRAFHHKGKNVGKWTWFNEDGSIRNTENYDRSDNKAN